METKSLTKVKIISVILVLAFLFTGCGPKATFKHPDDAVERYLNGETVTGLTVRVRTNSENDVVDFENKLGVIYNEGYKGSIIKSVVISLDDNHPRFEANQTYVIRIVEIHESRSGDIYIQGEIVN